MKKDKKSEWDEEKSKKGGKRVKSKSAKGVRERTKDTSGLYTPGILMSIYVNKRGLANAVQSKRGIFPATSRK